MALPRKTPAKGGSLGYTTFFRRWDPRNPPPALLLYGDARLLLREVVDQVIQTLCPPEIRDFVLNRYRAEETPAPPVLEAAQTLPVLASHRVVVVWGVEAWKRADLAHLERYLKDPVPTTCLVLVAPGLDPRKHPLPEWVQARGWLVWLPTPREEDLPAFLQARVHRRFQRRLDPEAAALLVAAVGTDLEHLDRELEKMVLHAGEAPVLDRATAEAVLTGARTPSVFEWVAAVGLREPARALALLARVLEGTSPLEALGTLLWRLRQIARALAAQAQGASPREAARTAGVFPRHVEGFLRQVARWRLEEMPAVFWACLEADLALKGGGSLPPERVLEDLVRQLCRRYR